MNGQDCTVGSPEPRRNFRVSRPRRKFVWTLRDVHRPHKNSIARWRGHFLPACVPNTADPCPPEVEAPVTVGWCLSCAVVALLYLYTFETAVALPSNSNFPWYQTYLVGEKKSWKRKGKLIEEGPCVFLSLQFKVKHTMMNELGVGAEPPLKKRR